MYEYPKDDLPHRLRCPHTIAIMRPLVCGECKVEHLAEVYLELKKLYYSGRPEVSDQNFDRYESLCRSKYPMCETFYTVGYQNERKTK